MTITKDSILTLVLLLVLLASGIDLYTDLSHGATLHHTLKEATIMLFAFGGIVWLLYSLRKQQHEIHELQHALDARSQMQKQPDEYVLEARKRFSEMVSRQFDAWQLTGSEKEVGWLLLKGLSLKEIAVIRNTLEKTVRQQASAIYRKAELPGRHAFAAWFLEDLL